MCPRSAAIAASALSQRKSRVLAALIGFVIGGGSFCGAGLPEGALPAGLADALQGAIEAIAANAQHLRGTSTVATAHFDDALDMKIAHLFKRQWARGFAGRLR